MTYLLKLFRDLKSFKSGLNQNFYRALPVHQLSFLIQKTTQILVWK